jgi:sec-independent protein translocase protein TatB
MSFADTVVLFVLALLLFGPKKLPGIARQVGKALAEFKRASNEFKAQIEAEISQLEIEERRKAEAQKLEKQLPAHAQPPEGSVEYSASKPETLEPAPPSHDLNLPTPNTNHA